MWMLLRFTSNITRGKSGNYFQKKTFLAVILANSFKIFLKSTALAISFSIKNIIQPLLSLFYETVGPKYVLFSLSLEKLFYPDATIGEPHYKNSLPLY